jgi:N-alpha-acetyltransferase 15/16, NatA auxiliary subunit
LQTLDFLTCVKSSRVSEFREACNKRFELSTVFKSPEEQAKIVSELSELSQKRQKEEEKKTESIGTNGVEKVVTAA